MTAAGIDRRFTKLEERVTDIENSHSASIYDLKRRLTGVEIVLEKSFARLLQVAGVPATEITQLTAATDEEIDAELEEDC
ncbi:hypothetical protein [Nocardia goodfellowii]|uniref:Uncharacterized protein n=1 Tax=Nocardia goodfellowii TaxID=882446 RepID=A0ABS4Q811_9NOCA|nr:hypothetical protein [Nocardia goodfellowii]MBP2187238.1 hypothetical protein [Nocardia goodfellowii]